MDELLLRGIRLFNDEVFQCHETLEEAWKPERGPRRLFLQALIHLAVGFYHCQRGKPNVHHSAERVRTLSETNAALRFGASLQVVCFSERNHFRRTIGRFRPVRGMRGYPECPSASIRNERFSFARIPTVATHQGNL